MKELLDSTSNAIPSATCTEIEGELDETVLDGDLSLPSQDIGRVQASASKRNARVQAKPRMSSKGKPVNLALIYWVYALYGKKYIYVIPNFRNSS